MELLTAENLVMSMYDLGLQLIVGDDGVVHGKMRDGGKLPLEAWSLVDQLRMTNDAVAGYLRMHPVTTLTWITPAECVEFGDRMKRGEIRVLGKVVYHAQSDLCDISYQEVSQDA